MADRSQGQLHGLGLGKQAGACAGRYSFRPVVVIKAEVMEMPMSPPVPCRHPGCRQLSTPGAAYCAAHRRPASNWAATDRGTSHARGYGWQWQKLRRSILDRDKGLCQACMKAGRVSIATHVDHITPKARGGSDAPGNLQALCAECHKEKTAAESKG